MGVLAVSESTEPRIGGVEGIRGTRQRDGSYAITPSIPVGLVTPEALHRIADVAEKYGATLKLTGAQRIALIGLRVEDVEAAWAELGMTPVAADRACVRGVKACPGSTFCENGLQDSLSLGLSLDAKYAGMPLPAPFKMGVSGCPRSCTEPAVKDIGVMGTRAGFTVIVGGSGGLQPRIGETLATGLAAGEVMALIDRIIGFYQANARPRERLYRCIDRCGFDRFRDIVLRQSPRVSPG